MRLVVALSVTLCSALAWGQSVPAPAGAAPQTGKTGYSAYEKTTIASALAKLRGALDPAPEGKLVESIEILRLEVLDDESKPLAKIPLAGPFLRPAIINPLHATTKDWIVRRELMLEKGDRFQQTLLDETARNLRRLKQLSLVIGVAMKGSSADKVKLLVITKDVWSLRLAYDMSLGPGGLESLTIQPSETNVAGTHQTATTQFSLTPLAYAIGAGYTVPRFGTSYVGASAFTSVIMNRERGEPEGTTGAVSLSRPLYTSLVPWAWGAKGEWTTNVVRRYINAQLANYDAKATPEIDAIPFEYKNRKLLFGAALTRSFGWANKTDLSLGYEFDRKAYRSFARPGQSQIALDEFRREVMPTSDTRSAPYAQLHVYTTNFHRITDFETLALQEDYRLGHDIYVNLYPVSQAFGSTRDFVGGLTSAQYTAPLGDGLTRFGVQAITEGTADRLTDASLQGVLHVVTPRFGIGRVVLDLRALNRYRNYLNTQTFLGGDTRLRGFPSNYLFGKDYIVGNLEFRSRPVNLLSLQTALALFYDVGDAAPSWRELSMKQAAGFGLRALIPQLNRVVFRGDIGFPLMRPLPTGVSAASFFLSFEQAFELGSLGPT